ncbi:replicative DNA helicase [Candidatus Arsenophonus triatominarum]|uniref:replicative DNA helicase n=1 Tax=Candidatus Arsenophonus triatominarum TaxID=57911 RepID=UPI0007C55CA9|nr:DnaB-like helicase C-terminal domain-containing protein [Candidatus Arsenophonus triatominarum]
MRHSVNQVPNNLPAEQSVIGGLLIDPMSDNALKVFSLLSPDDFYAVHHRLIYAEMRAMSRKREAIDIITVDEALSKSGIAQKAGGFAYLAEIAKNIPSAANIVSYAKSIKECAVGRYTVEKAIEIQKLFIQPNALGFSDKIDMAQRLIDEAAKFGKVGYNAGLSRIDDVLDNMFTEICDRQDNPEKDCGLKTGFRDFDDLLKPKQIVNGSLFVIGARPKVGKTTVLTEMAKNVSNQGKAVLLFSMEMTDCQLAERMLSQQSNLNSNRFYEKLEEHEWDELCNAMGRLKQQPNIWIDDTPAMTLHHIQSECRKIKRKIGDIGFIGVDYLTLMQAEKADRNDLAYGNITKGLKVLAKELNTVVVLLTQLNRSLEQRTNKRPMPSDSRDTGQIEQDCDYWLGIHRESVYDTEADKTLTELILRLNRHGKTGTVYVDQKGLSISPVDQHVAAAKSQPQKEPKRYSDKKF